MKAENVTNVGIEQSLVCGAFTKIWRDRMMSLDRGFSDAQSMLRDENDTVNSKAQSLGEAELILGGVLTGILDRV